MTEAVAIFELNGKQARAFARTAGVFAAVAVAIMFDWSIGGVARASAEGSFQHLKASEIRAKVIGNDITDRSHWVSYLRPDGVLFSDEMGRKWTGSWKVQNNKLCISNPNLEAPYCNEVWMSGSNIRMRANKDQETFDAVVETHRAN